ncbi:hypothetical protein V1288_001404 [Bradyrhizobium sp. AZCC 2176]
MRAVGGLGTAIEKMAFVIHPEYYYAKHLSYKPPPN